MIKQLSLLVVLGLASGCASHTSDNRVVASERSSPYATTESTIPSYDNNGKGAGARSMMQNPYAENTFYAGPAVAESTFYYGIYTLQGYDNTSKGAGARSMMQNPYADNTLYTVPAGGAITVGGTETETTSKGAGGRSLKGETSETP